MRKVALAGLALSIGLLGAACGDSEAGDGSSVTMWMYPVIADQEASRTFWSEFETEFEDANPDIDLTIELQPWDGRQETISTALASGTGFDIVLLGPDQIPQHAEQGSLVPVDDMVADSVDAFLPNAVESLSVDGTLYGVPIYHTVVTPVYNKKVFAEAGITEPPATWDDLLAAAGPLAEKGIPVFDYPGDPEETLNLTFYPLLWQAGGQIFADDGKSVAFDQAPGVAALQFLADLREAGGLPPDAPTVKNSLEGRPFTSGESGVLQAADLATANQLIDSLGADTAVPIPPLTGEEQVTFGIPGSLVVSHATESQDAVAEVLRFVSSAETATKLAEASGFFPARSDVDMPADGPHVDVFADALEHAYPGDAHPQARQVMSILAPQVQAVLTGDKTPEQALADAAAEANPILAG
ncbi:ABC transporter substrate-binding protein [Actinophytocola gossypii]|uniref:Extracellular solute-binding protein n=1 Tax=Actinophytocola gossypii TaxID=2812003 RepID=A0ABT2J601_9PSEU|nr:extracellular solute-binding protein [Actinophytocola gossypii]MCT2583106.1 extracellular solute-binding protein [Actinophytocola gossypii]